MVSLYLYALLGLVNSCPVPEKVGLGMLGIVGVSFMFNLGVFCLGVVSAIRDCLQKRKMRDAVIAIKPISETVANSKATRSNITLQDDF